MASENKLFLDGFSVDLIDSEPQKEYTEWQSRDGFMSSNRGGIELSLQLLSGFSSGSYITKRQRKFVDEMRVQCLRDFEIDNDIDEMDFNNDDMMQRLSDYEMEYFSDVDVSLLQFRIVIDDDMDVITIDLSICYNDAPYYRSNKFELIASLDLTFEQFKRIEFKTLERYFKRALKRA